MKKVELVAKIAGDAKITKKQAELALKSFMNNIACDLKKGNKTQLIGFGTFSTIVRAARTGVNPATGKKIKIAKSISPKFKASASLKQLVNRK